MSLSLVTVGTGTVAPSATRCSPAHWVEAEGLKLLMDCGAGTVHGLARCGLDWPGLTHLALTHFHTDHVGEVPALIFALRHAVVPARTAPLTIIGPVGTLPLLRRLATAVGDWLVDPGFGVTIVELVPGQQHTLVPGITLDACPVPHTGESVALSVRTAGSRLVYTGDTGPSDTLAHWAEDCDLLLAECSLPDALAMTIHLTPRQAGALAQTARAKRLVLTHLYPPVEAVDVLGEVRTAYTGPAAIAVDGARFAC